MAAVVSRADTSRVDLLTHHESTAEYCGAGSGSLSQWLEPKRVVLGDIVVVTAEVIGSGSRVGALNESGISPATIASNRGRTPYMNAPPCEQRYFFSR